jgi:predicted transcriptional regulator
MTMTTDDRLARQVAIRLSDDDMKRLDALAESLPIASRNAIARAALRIGLDVLEADPSRLLSTKKPKTRRR